jgi:hypothetical protein
MDNVQSQPLSRHGDGYLDALGYLQIGAGSLSVLMSLMLCFQALFSHAELRSLASVFSSSLDLIDRAIAIYVALQLSIGWAAGGLQFAAGICCLRGTNLRLVWAASLISLANFPHGTIAAVAMIWALRRPDIRCAFAPRAIT